MKDMEEIGRHFIKTLHRNFFEESEGNFVKLKCSWRGIYA